MSENKKCPICLTPCEWINNDVRPVSSLIKVECPQCGTFEVEGNFNQQFNPENPLVKEKIGLASGWIRENNYEILSLEIIKGLNDLPDLSPRQKAFKYLKNLSKEYISIGSKWCIDTEYPPDRRFLSFAWVNKWDEHDYVMQEILEKHEELLMKLGDIDHPKTGNRVKEWSITPKGWEELEQSTNIDSKIGFIAMSFEKTLKEVNSAIEKGIEKAGYEPVIMNKVEHNNRIDDEIIAQIKKSRFVVADLAFQNQGAYFEAGFALGLGLPVIWSCEKSEVDDKKVHFDTRQFNTLHWEKNKLKIFTKALVNRIEATIGRGGLK